MPFEKCPDCAGTGFINKARCPRCHGNMIIDVPAKPKQDPERPALLWEALKVIPLRPEDVLVFRTPKSLGQADLEGIQASLSVVLPKGAKVLVLDGGADVDVIRIGA